MTKKGVLFFCALLCVMLTPCKKPISVSVLPDAMSVSNPSQMWIDAPLQQANIPLAPYNIVFHGTSSDGISAFEVRINGESIAIVPAAPSSSGGAKSTTLYLGEFLWTPLAPGTYLIKVLSGSNGEFSSSAQVQVTINGEESDESKTEESTPTASLTATATATSTPTPTQEEAEACGMKALVNLFCRPSPGYEPSDSFTPGQTAPVVAQSQWLWKVIGAKKGRECTVPKDKTLVEVTGDCESLPTFNPLPTPTNTATPTPRPTETPEPGCTVRQPGGAIQCVSPCPAGAAPGNACTP